MDLITELQYVYGYISSFAQLCKDKNIDVGIVNVSTPMLTIDLKGIEDIETEEQLFFTENDHLRNMIIMIAKVVAVSSDVMEGHESDRMRHEKFIHAVDDAYKEYRVNDVNARFKIDAMAMNAILGKFYSPEDDV